jgi:hypothetical protein
MLLALTRGTLFGGAHLAALLALEAAFGLAAAAALLCELRVRGAADGEAAVGVGLLALSEVWADRNVRVLSGLLFLGFGAFIALPRRCGRWSSITAPSGVSSPARSRSPSSARCSSPSSMRWQSTRSCWCRSACCC